MQDEEVIVTGGWCHHGTDSRLSTEESHKFIQPKTRTSRTSTLSNQHNTMRSKSTQTLLNVVEDYTAGDVMEFTKSRYAATASGVGKNKSHNVAPSSVIVIDSTMTPLEAATLLWENNM